VVVAERLGALTDVVVEVKDLVKCLDGRLDTFERQYIERHTQVVADVRTHTARLDDYERRLDALEKIVQPLVMYARILSFIGGAAGLSIIALIWALLTGQATVSFP
jgi:hypothetical protein